MRFYILYGFLKLFNLFPANVFISYCIVNILILEKERIMGKNSYQRRAYESVDDRSLS